jgi:methylene-fatty-acyl-phospholipid synthase
VRLWLFLSAAAALAVERAVYVWIARRPRAFRALCAPRPAPRLGGPVAVVGALFSGFKLLQLSVFAAWCYALGGGSLVPSELDPRAAALGGVLLLAGQTLNWSVFYRLGAVGVFYGDRLGHDVPWCRAFPFSVCAHPQYAGAVLSIWGLFLAARFPHDDWPLIPALETAYYVVSTYLEDRQPSRGAEVRSPPPRMPPAAAIARIRALRALLRPTCPASRPRPLAEGAPAGRSVIEASRRARHHGA